MLDELIPPASPSGHLFRRRENKSIEEVLMRIATGKQAHLTTSSFLEHHRGRRAASRLAGIQFSTLDPG